MKRKIVKHGPSSLIVSLPSAWARKYGVKQGDEIDVDVEGSRLVIDSNKEKVMPEVTLDISKLPHKLVNSFLIGAYQRGYDKVNVLFNDKKQFTPIQKKIQEFLGFEIMERTNEGCVIQSIAKNLDIDFQMSLRKVFLIVKNMTETMLKSYENGDKESLKHLYYKDYDVNKFCNFCLRSINKEANFDKLQETHLLYHLVERLENLGDSCKRLSRMLARIKKDKDLILILKKLNEYFDVAYDIFYKPKQKGVVDASKKDQEIVKLIQNATRNAIKNKSLQKMYALYLVHDITKMIHYFPSRRIIDTIESK